jgi:hypothetical protein
MIYSLYDPDLKEISVYKDHVKKSKRLERRKSERPERVPDETKPV